MYGLVNQGLRDLAVETGGEALWVEIATAAGVGPEQLLSMDVYPDEMTYRLVATASDAMGMSPAEVLHAFGRHWIMYTARRGYGALFDMMGRTLPEFLGNLDAMHTRLTLSMPSLRPPAILCEPLSSEQLRLEYRTERPGLVPMLLGLLDGLADLYDLTLSVTQTVDRADGADHDEFLITYRPTPAGTGPAPALRDRRAPPTLVTGATADG